MNAPRHAPRSPLTTSLSLRARLTLRWTVAFGLVLTLALLLVFIGARTFGYAALDLHLRTVAATELASSTDQGAPIHLHEFPVGALNDHEFAPKFSLIYAADGTLVAHTGGFRPGDMELDHGFREDALAGRTPLIDIEWQGRHGRLIALRAEGESGQPYVLAVGMLADRLDENLTRLLWVLLGVWVAALGVTAVVGYHLASRALQPIDRITQRAGEIARDRIDARLDPPGTDDEIGRMTRLLNEMLDRLHGVIDANRRFAADASHELRSPLTAIAGEIDVALKRERSAAEYEETLRVVRQQLSEMFTLADNLTLLVQAEERADAVPLRPVPVDVLLAGVAHRLASLAAQRQVHLALPARVAPGLRVFGDADLMARALDNVVGNALQYTPAGGRVDVNVEWQPPPDGDTWTPGRVRLLVRDTGPGIPVDEWERIFDRFYRLDASRSRRTGGTGLGLAITRAIVALFGGTVRVVASSTGMAGAAGHLPSPVSRLPSTGPHPASTGHRPPATDVGAEAAGEGEARSAEASGEGGTTFEIVLPGERADG
jgi:two-component system OmpR family sensor kinase